MKRLRRLLTGGRSALGWLLSPRPHVRGSTVVTDSTCLLAPHLCMPTVSSLIDSQP